MGNVVMSFNDRALNLLRDGILTLIENAGQP